MPQSSAGGFNRRLAPLDSWCGRRRGEITGGAASTEMLQTNMLQAEKTRGPQTSAAYSEDAGSGGMGEIINFALGLLRRQYLVIVLTAVFAVTSCIIYLRITPPTYTARVQVLLANPRGHSSYSSSRYFPSQPSTSTRSRPRFSCSNRARSRPQSSLSLTLSMTPISTVPNPRCPPYGAVYQYGTGPRRSNPKRVLRQGCPIP